MPIGEDAEFLSPRDFARHLRKHPTNAERAHELKNTKCGFKFRRQFQFDEKTFVDLCCTSVKVIVELDGESHSGKVDADIARDRRLSDAGFLVLRFPNEEVLEHTERVVAAIVKQCEGRTQRRY